MPPLRKVYSMFSWILAQNVSKYIINNINLVTEEMVKNACRHWFIRVASTSWAYFTTKIRSRSGNSLTAAKEMLVLVLFPMHHPRQKAIWRLFFYSCIKRSKDGKCLDHCSLANYIYLDMLLGIRNLSLVNVFRPKLHIWYNFINFIKSIFHKKTDEKK